MFANLTKRLFDKLSRKGYRDAYVAEHVTTGIAMQIRALREQRGWKQGKFARQLEKPQSVANRLESLDYGKYSLKSLLEVASAFDVALVVRFVSYPDFLKLYANVTPEAFEVDSFTDSVVIANEDGDRVVAETSTMGEWRRIPVRTGAPAGSSMAKVGPISMELN